MFPGFLKKLAGKADLDNIRMDLVQLKRSFPLDPAQSSKYIFSIHKEICLAFANRVSPQEVRNVIDKSCENDNSGLQPLLVQLIALNIARFNGDHATALQFDKEMQHLFLAGTGVPLDFGQRTFLQKRGRR
jgi:hypothetical protein